MSTGGTFDLSGRHYDGQNGLQTHFACQCSVFTVTVMHLFGVNRPLHIAMLSPSPCPFPSKFNILLMGTDHLMCRMDSTLPASIDTVINFDRHCNGVGTC